MCRAKDIRLPSVCMACAFLVCALVASVSVARSCGKAPPPAAPQRRKAGESVPPLPLPATPLRRTEKKRPPAPPALVGKLEYGKTVWATDENGRRYSYRDWTTDPADITYLIRRTNREIGIRYRSVHTSFEKFSYDPAEIPILYLTGHEGFTFSEQMRQKLRWFLNDGGYLVGDACCGQKPFTEAFIREMKTLFPRRPLRLLPPDHPVYTCYYQLDKVGYMLEGKSGGRRPPMLYGIDLGCRTAVLLSPYDLSCGWEGHDHETGERVVIEDARRLGVNMLTYCLANYQLGRFLSTQKVYYQEGQPTRDQFVFGQVVHEGDWDPVPSGIMSLLKYAVANSTMEVQFKRQAVDLRRPEALEHPILYMTGHYDFVLTDAEVAGLRNYLRHGGILLGDACCGRKSFDLAFRRELKRVLPQFDLQPVPLNHPVYSARATVRQVRYSGIVQSQEPDLHTPQLEGIRIGGTMAVIYSRYGLGTSWDGQTRPYSRCYGTEDALRLGLNVLVYAMTH